MKNKILNLIFLFCILFSFSSFAAATASEAKINEYTGEDAEDVNYLANGYAIIKADSKYALVYFNSSGIGNIYYDTRTKTKVVGEDVEEVQKIMGALHKDYSIPFPKTSIKQGKRGDFKSVLEKLAGKLGELGREALEALSNVLNKMVDALNAMNYSLLYGFTKAGNLKSDISNNLMDVGNTEMDSYLEKINGLATLKNKVSWDSITKVASTEWDPNTMAAIYLILDQLIKDKSTWYASCPTLEKYLVLNGLIGNFYMSGIPIHQSEHLATGWNVYFKYLDYPYTIGLGNEKGDTRGLDYYTIDSDMYVPDTALLLPTVNSFKYVCDNHDYCAEENGFLIASDKGVVTEATGGLKSVSGQVGQIKKGWSLSGYTSTATEGSVYLTQSSEMGYLYHKGIYDNYCRQYSGKESEFDKIIPPIHAIYSDLAFIINESKSTVGTGTAWDVWLSRCQELEKKLIFGKNKTVKEFCQGDISSWTLQDCATFVALSHFYYDQYMVVKNSGGGHIYNGNKSKLESMYDNSIILGDLSLINEYLWWVGIYERGVVQGNMAPYYTGYSFNENDNKCPCVRSNALVIAGGEWKTLGESLINVLNRTYFPIADKIKAETTNPDAILENGLFRLTYIWMNLLQGKAWNYELQNQKIIA